MPNKNTLISDNNPLYLLIEQLMHENVESNQYLSHKKACDAIVASLLLSEHKREKQLKLLFVESNTLNQYIDALTHDEMRDALLLSVSTLCKKYVQAISDHPSRDLGELVVNNRNIHEKAATSHRGLSCAVATALSHGISYECKLGNHLLQMNRHERAFFHFLAKLRTLTGKSKLVFTANPDYTDFSTKQMDRLLRQLIGDAPIEITLTHQSLNDSNADAYAKLLSAKNSLALTLIENDRWSDQNINLVTNALKE